MPTSIREIVRESLVVDECKIASELAQVISGAEGVRVQLLGKNNEVDQTVELSRSHAQLLNHVLSEMALGNSITVMPLDGELTTQQAADFLKVSRPFLVDLLERGDIPFRKVGTHRRVVFRDLLSYKKRSEARREKALQELADQAQELEMGY